MISRFKKKVPGENKHRNKKVEFDGIKFDSKDELRYYHFLKADSTVQKIERCRRFPIIPSFNDTVNGIKYRGAYYTADFEVTRTDGRFEIHEFKNPYNRKEPAYRLRVKLFRQQYPDLIFIQADHTIFKRSK